MNNSLLGLALEVSSSILIYLLASHLCQKRENMRKTAYWAILAGNMLGFFIYASKK